MSRDFRELLESNRNQRKFLCVGLDPDLEKIPNTIWGKNVRERFVAFDRAIIDATRDLVGAYKPNTAFYEAQGGDLAAPVAAAKGSDNSFLISVSRSILYASHDGDFAKAARAQAQRLVDSVDILA